MVQAARIAWDFLAHICSRADESADIPALTTGLSLASTMRKLLLTLVPSETDRVTRARLQLWADQPLVQQGWVADREALVEAANALEPILVGALSALNSLHRPTTGGGRSSRRERGGGGPGACSSFVICSGGGGGGSGGGGGVLVHNASSSDGTIWVGRAGGGGSSATITAGGTFKERVMGRMGLRALPPGGTADLNDERADTPRSQAAAVEPVSSSDVDTESGSDSDGDGDGSMAGDRGTTPDTPEIAAQRLVVVHQLQALLCLTLTQLFRWRLECPGISHRMASMGEALQAVAELPFDGLRRVVGPLLEEDSLAVPQSEVNAAWEAYAAAHFGGRLLPGCCSLACASLEGISEAAVEVQLCGGCRRARYCCKACQKAAWKDHGHSNVCGK